MRIAEQLDNASMKIDFQTVNHELMALSGVKRAAILCIYDLARDEWVYRWFADAKTAGFRIPVEDLAGECGNDVLNRLDERLLKPVLAAWKASEDHPNPEAEFERLKNYAANSGFARWAEATHE